MMSQYQYDDIATIAPRPVNALAVAGFTCSLVGLLLTGGLICPVGLLISLVALGRAPRGLAVAGIIIGLLGSFAAVFVIIGLALTVAGFAAVGAQFLLYNPTPTQLTMDMITITSKIEQHKQANGFRVPDDLSGMEIDGVYLMDPWDTPYRYDLTDTELGYDIVSAGEDGDFDTEDDYALSRMEEIWKGSWANFQEEMKEAAENRPGPLRIRRGPRDSTGRAPAGDEAGPGADEDGP